MAARLRHIAISVPDPEKAAKFFEEAFGMKVVGPAGLGLYVSDGTINVALLKFPGDVPGFAPGYHGILHFGIDRFRRRERRAMGDVRPRVRANDGFIRLQPGRSLFRRRQWG